MKIYPNKLTVKIKNEINKNNDIQLAYVDTTSSVYNVNTLIKDKYKTAKNVEVLPYDNVDTNICLFNKQGDQIPYESMIQDFVEDNKKYIYIPKNNSIKFSPKTFEYYIKAKKNIKYKSNDIYNIKVRAENKNIANKLMPIFGDAKNRNLAPNNVLINNGDLSLDKLYGLDINDSDISFLLLKDFNTLLNEDNSTQTFNKKYYLEEYDTTFFCIIKNDAAIKDYEGIEYDKEKVNLLMSNVNNRYTSASKNLYSDVLNSRYYFNIPSNTVNKKYYSIFSELKKTPILIENNVGTNCIVYITEELINDVKKYYKAIYESMLYIYLNGYKKSDVYTSWIADVVPDYIVENNKLLKKTKFVSKLTPADMLGIQSNSFSNLNVYIDSEKYPYVSYTGLYNNYLSFEKIKGENNEYIDPQIKPDGWISVYSNYEIFFYKEFVYRINDNLEECVNFKINTDSIIFEFKNFRHSDSGIFIKNINSPLEISLIENKDGIDFKVINVTYYLICNSLMQFELVKNTDYKDGIILMTIDISQDTEQTENILFDMRQRGGGLPEDEKDNYDCFDIGNIYGRPYRKGGSLIITLPKYMEEYKDIIMSIIKQYMLADDYPIIIFEDKK